MNTAKYALRALRREFLAGDLLTIFVALTLGVAAMTAVGTLVNRVNLALTENASEILGGDLGLSSRQEIPEEFAEEARRRGLQTAYIVSFPTVLFHADASQMASVKAVDAGYPLRGQLWVALNDNGAGTMTAPAPAVGEAYADSRLLAELGLKVGDDIEFGMGTLKVSHVLKSEPDASGELLQMAPPLLVNRADVDAVGLLGPGSRAQYRLMFAGDADLIASFKEWLKPRSSGMRLMSIEDSRRGMRETFDRAGRFLAMTALLAVLLAGVATALAANRFAIRRIDDIAVLRCLGARQHDILMALTLQLILLAIPACLLGVALGMSVQSGLVATLGALIPDRLPLPQAAPVLTGAGIGLFLLLGFGLPPLLRLRDVPPMRVLNRSFAALPPASLLVYLAALAATIGMTAFVAGDVELTAWILGGLTILALLTALAGTGLLWALRLLQARLHGTWRLGLAALTRRRALNVVQLIGLALSLCALLLLVIVGPGLLGQWRARLPADTPNYFLINIQPDQTDAVRSTLRDFGIANPELEPFGTGRLLAINDRPPQQQDPNTDTGENDSNRPVNFSWRHDFPDANTLVSGRFWEPGSTAAEASVEQRWAERHGIGLGDELTLQMGEQQHRFLVTSLRKADWDSFRVNFFLLLNAGAITAETPYNLISSFHLGKEQSRKLAVLTRQFPNISVIDIDAILDQVRAVIDRVAQAVQLVMGFSLIAGILVLLAALQATASERRYDSAVLRTLGARRRQLHGAVLVEFGILGLLAAFLAVAAATAIGMMVARQVFDLALTPPWSALLLGGILGTLLSAATGWFGMRRILLTPPMLALRDD
ncbi:MAG: FtsX-like permease family protein [Xanthomonadaceae bacterium]|jgi:putative ABC transport system permease protein|nr:FtsX-like permease family protein [Xanthomonadaceae bacterium]